MRSFLVLTGLLALATAAAFACSSSSSSDPGGEDQQDGGGDEVPPTAKLPPPSGGTGPAGTGLATGLPCDVQAVIENRCLACHSGTSPPPLTNYDDLVAKSKTDPTKTLAQLSLERMKSTTSPMPPPPAVKPDVDEIQTFEDWVKAGTPKGAVCTDAPPDAGAPKPDGGADAGGVVCTSGVTWKDGDNGSPLMHPGAACNACHQVKGGPNLRIAGTVYPTLHEPNDCNGSKPPLTVVITGADNKVTNLQVNAAGNFDTTNRIKAPYRAKITDGTKTRAMTGSVTSGDCNSCHTPTGLNGAPGRIMAP